MLFLKFTLEAYGGPRVKFVWKQPYLLAGTFFTKQTRTSLRGDRTIYCPCAKRGRLSARLGNPGHRDP